MKVKFSEMNLPFRFRGKRDGLNSEEEWVEGFLFYIQVSGESVPCIGLEPLIDLEYGQEKTWYYVYPDSIELIPDTAHFIELNDVISEACTDWNKIGQIVEGFEYMPTCKTISRLEYFLDTIKSVSHNLPMVLNASSKDILAKVCEISREYDKFEVIKSSVYKFEDKLNGLYAPEVLQLSSAEISEVEKLTKTAINILLKKDFYWKYRKEQIVKLYKIAKCNVKSPETVNALGWALNRLIAEVRASEKKYLM